MFVAVTQEIPVVAHTMSALHAVLLEAAELFAAAKVEKAPDFGDVLRRTNFNTLRGGKVERQSLCRLGEPKAPCRERATAVSNAVAVVLLNLPVMGLSFHQ